MNLSMNRKGIKGRLLFSFIIISLILMVIGALGRMFQDEIVKSYSHIVNVNLPNAVLLGDMNQDVSKMSQGILELSLGTLKKEDSDAIIEKINISINDFDKGKLQYESVKSTAEGEAEVYAPIKEHWPKLKELVLTNIELADSKDSKKKEQFIKNFQSEIGPLFKDFSENLSFVLDFQKAASSENVENASSAAKKSQIWLTSLLSVGMIFSISFGFYFATSISNGLSKLAMELGEVVLKIKDESGRMSYSSKGLSLSVEEQAAALQETSSSTEELSAMVKRNEENAENSKDLSDKSTHTAQKGKVAMQSMMVAIQGIDSSNKEILVNVETSNQNISEISNYIKLIGEKTKIINDIVFQTKLLSFNASVEAARAGEQGKGFAVVAEEVGNLAQMSGNAAKEISDMLESSLSKVEAIVEKSKKEVEHLVNQSKIKIEQGIDTAQNCEQVLTDVVDNVTLVNDMLLEISHASKEQTIGISEISKAIAQLDANTSANTQTAKSTEVTSNSLLEQAKLLEEMVQKINLAVKGE
jgi:methyl-accepting chemotaxis protein